MKQTMQQTAVQRAMQPVARPIPTGTEQFDMGDGEEDAALEAPSYTLQKEMQRKAEETRAKRARLTSISEEELAAPGQIDEMMAERAAAAAASTADFSYGSAAASSSGYGGGSSTAIVPVGARTQAIEEQIQGNLRGGVVPAALRPTRYDWSRAAQHRRSDSGASTESAASAASAVSTATTVAIPPQIQQKMDIDTLVHISRQLRVALNARNTDDDAQLAMEIMTHLLIIEKLRSNEKYKTVAGGKAYIKSKKRLLDIVETTPI